MLVIRLALCASADRSASGNRFRNEGREAPG
jgi:hypothetical protein